jgi:hypothetical protein
MEVNCNEKWRKRESSPDFEERVTEFCLKVFKHVEKRRNYIQNEGISIIYCLNYALIISIPPPLPLFFEQLHIPFIDLAILFTHNLYQTISQYVVKYRMLKILQ